MGSVGRGTQDSCDHWRTWRPSAGATTNGSWGNSFREGGGVEKGEWNGLQWLRIFVQMLWGAKFCLKISPTNKAFGGRVVNMFNDNILARFKAEIKTSPSRQVFNERGIQSVSSNFLVAQRDSKGK